MKFKNVIATGLITTTLFGATMTAQAQTSNFNDLPSGHWSEEAINYLSNRGIVYGYGNGVYGFGDKVTRGQVASIMARYFKLQNNGTGTTQFTDIQGHMFEQDIKSISQAGIMIGDGTDKFRPDDTLTRYEMSKVLQHAFNLAINGNMSFNDVPNGHWAKDAIQALYTNRVTDGIGNNQYGGQYSVTREQFAKFMYNAIFSNSNPDAPSELKTIAKSFGFIDRGNGYLAYNPYGEKGDDSFDVMHFYPQRSGQWDAKMFIYSGNSAINEPTKALMNKLLPTKGDYLYAIVDNPNLPYTKQEFELDGRTVVVHKTSVLNIYFGPVKN